MSTFRLQSGDTEFNTRVDALFSSLQSAAKDLEPQLKREHEEEPEEVEDGEGRKRQCFSRPRGRPPQWRGRGGRGRGRGGSGPRNSTPDYIKNPQKWTQYSMRDTKVLSDSENKREGLKLLADLSTRSDDTETAEKEEMELDEDNKPKIVFKKPAVPPLVKTDDPKVMSAQAEEEKEVVEEARHTSVFDGSRKFHKPEYVVGRAKPKNKKVTKLSLTEEEEEEEEEDATEKKEVKLSYLMFEEED